MGETGAAKKARIEEATRGATDLSALIKKKPKPANDTTGIPNADNQSKAHDTT